jgi:hypothetical protein
MTREEKKWVWIFAGIVMALTSVPYLVAYSQFGGRFVFTGFLIGVEDGNSYIAKMLSGSVGAWLFRTPYSAYPQNGIFAFFIYLLLGKLASPPGVHEQLVALFHLFRIAAGGIGIYALYAFLAVFIQDVRLRRLGTILGTLGGGLGWLLILAGQNNWLGSLPLDFYSPETFGFLEVYSLPHLALARALLFFAFIAYLGARKDLGTAIESSSTKPLIITGVLLLLTGILQPLTALIGWVVIGAHQLVILSRELFGEKIPVGAVVRGHLRVGWVFLISSPIILYTGYASIVDSFMKGWTAQNIIHSPNPLHYLVAYGVILPLAVIGLIKLLRRGFWQGSFLTAWGILFPFLAYFPYNLQRRLPEGIWIVWVVGAMFLLQDWPRGRKRVSGSLLLLSLPSTLILILGSTFTALNPGLPIYRPQNEVRAFEFLAATVDRDQVVMTSYDTGNGLSAWAPVRVVIGHGPETVNLAVLKGQVNQFYQAATSDAFRIQMIKEFNIQYIFRGPLESQLGGWDPAAAPYLKRIYAQDGYAVYSVYLEHPLP